MSSKHVIVRGTVQGVFYRASAQRRAGELGVAGWVRNRADGTVEMLVEGDDDAVATLLDWARSGPRHAEVTALDVTEVEPQGLHGFTQA